MADGTDTDSKIIYPELTYKIRGIFFDLANQYGLGLKEKVYHEAFIDGLIAKNFAYQHEKQIQIYSWQNGRKIGTYIPDFVIDNKVIVEFKSEPFITPHFINQVQSYLRVSDYEVAFIVNFGSVKLEIKRYIFTNDRKSGLKTNNLHS
jgi:GxxExxY protein